MINVASKKPLKVSTARNAPPYLRLPVEQLDDVRALLDAHGFTYWVDLMAISVDGAPEVTVINFGHGTDPDAVQKVLDDAA